MAFFFTQLFVTFISIFLRGVQTQNVVSGNYLGAFITSTGMVLANLVFINLASTDLYASLIPCMIGASTGVTGAMYYKRNLASNVGKLFRGSPPNDR